MVSATLFSFECTWHMSCYPKTLRQAAPRSNQRKLAPQNSRQASQASQASLSSWLLETTKLKHLWPLPFVWNRPCVALGSRPQHLWPTPASECWRYTGTFSTKVISHFVKPKVLCWYVAIAPPSSFERSIAVVCDASPASLNASDGKPPE